MLKKRARLDTSLSIPAPAGYSEGWHHVALSWDSRTGAVQVVKVVKVVRKKGIVVLGRRHVAGVLRWEARA